MVDSVVWRLQGTGVKISALKYGTSSFTFCCICTDDGEFSSTISIIMCIDGDDARRSTLAISTIQGTKLANLIKYKQL